MCEEAKQQKQQDTEQQPQLSGLQQQFAEAAVKACELCAGFETYLEDLTGKHDFEVSIVARRKGQPIVLITNENPFEIATLFNETGLKHRVEQTVRAVLKGDHGEDNFRAYIENAIQKLYKEHGEPVDAQTHSE